MSKPKPLMKRIRKKLRNFVAAPLVSPWSQEKMKSVLGESMFEKPPKKKKPPKDGAKRSFPSAASLNPERKQDNRDTGSSSSGQ